MPRVSTYGLPSVRSQGIPSARRTAIPSPDAFGAGFGEVAANIGLRGLAEQEAEKRRQAQLAKQRADQIAILEADNNLATWENSRLLDPEKGALNVKGKDALGLPEAVGQEFDEVAGTLAQSMATPEQRDGFHRAQLLRRRSIDVTLARHVSAQIQAYDKEEFGKSLVNSRNAAIANAADPRRVGLELQRQTDNIEQFATANGLGPEAKASLLDEARTATHEGVIDRLLTDGKDTAAQVYFEETKSQISGDSLAKIERALEEGSLMGESQRKADEISGSAKTLTEARDAVKQITDPKLRDAVQTRVEHEWAIKEAEERDTEEQKLKDIGNLIDQKGLRAVSPAVWSTLTVQQKAGFENYAKRNLTDGEGKTDLPFYYSLMTQASTNPEGFSKLILSDPKYLSKLGKTEFKQLAELQNSIRKGEKVDEKLDGFRTNEQIVNDTLDLAGIARTGDDADHGTIAQFRKALDQRVGELQRLTGKKATNEDVQRLSDDLIQKQIAVPDSWFQRLLGHPFTGKRLMSVGIADIPGADRRNIEAALKKHGVPPTEQNIVQAFIDMQVRGK